jgi:hypothetical protein
LYLFCKKGFKLTHINHSSYKKRDQCRKYCDKAGLKQTETKIRMAVICWVTAAVAVERGFEPMPDQRLNLIHSFVFLYSI